MSTCNWKGPFAVTEHFSSIQLSFGFVWPTTILFKICLKFPIDSFTRLFSTMHHLPSLKLQYAADKH